LDPSDGDLLTDPDVLREQLEIASSAADAIGVFGFPLGIHYMDSLTDPVADMPHEQIGVFAKRESYRPDSEIVAFWPGVQPHLAGWYQSWTTEALTGDIEIQIRDTNGSSDTTGRLFQRVYLEGSATPIYQEDVALDDGAGTVVSVIRNLLTPTKVTVSLELEGNLGNFASQGFFRVIDSSENPIPVDDFTFESGIRVGLDPTDLNDQGWKVVHTYEVVHCAYKIIWFASTLSPLGLPGDYSGNGVVDAADFTVWRDSLGSQVLPFTGADADGSGGVDQCDYEIWRMNFGATLPSPSFVTTSTADATDLEISYLAKSAPQANDYVPPAARAASFAVLETRSPWQDSGSRSRGRINRHRVTESGGDDLLLLATDRVWRSPRQNVSANADRGRNDQHTGTAALKSFVDEPLANRSKPENYATFTPAGLEMHASGRF